MRISIIGTGALGGYYGILLAKAGNEVHFLLHNDYDFVKKHGLRIQSDGKEDVYLPEVNAYNRSEDMPESDVILVCLKTTQNREVLPKLIAPLTKKNPVVILVQNGLGMEEDLSKMFPGLGVAGGIALIAAEKNQKGIIRHHHYGHLDLGNFNIPDPMLLSHFSEQLTLAGIPSEVQPLNLLRWKKLEWNIPFNGLSALTNKTTSQLLNDSESVNRIRAIMMEVIQAAKACGVIISEDTIEKLIAFSQKMGIFSTSMKQDFDRGRHPELYYMYERPAAIAMRAGYEMKLTKALFHELQRLDSTSQQK